MCCFANLYCKHPTTVKGSVFCKLQWCVSIERTWPGNTDHFLFSYDCQEWRVKVLQGVTWQPGLVCVNVKNNKRLITAKLIFIIGWMCSNGLICGEERKQLLEQLHGHQMCGFVQFVEWYLKAEKLDMLYGCDSHWLCRDLISHMDVSLSRLWVCVRVSISVVSALTLQVCLPQARLQRGREREEYSLKK